MTVPALFTVSEKPLTELKGADNVLFLGNALGTDTHLWDLALPTLAAKYSVVRFDMPGHGQSPIPNDSFTLEEVADALVAKADELGVEKFDYAVAMLEGHCPKIPGAGNGYAAIISGPTESELISTGAILLAAEYNTNQALLTGEIGTHLTGTRLLRSDMAKQFRGAGASAADTMSSGDTAVACVAGATSISLNTSAAQTETLHKGAVAPWSRGPSPLYTQTLQSLSRP
jgi:hypothetical protein